VIEVMAQDGAPGGVRSREGVLLGSFDPWRSEDASIGL
jgi:hypothetical protein